MDDKKEVPFSLFQNVYTGLRKSMLEKFNTPSSGDFLKDIRWAMEVMYIAGGMGITASTVATLFDNESFIYDSIALYDVFSNKLNERGL